MKNCFILILYLLIGFPTVSFTQSTILEDYIKTALENNLSIKGEQLNQSKQLVRIEQARKNWMPSVDGNANYLLSDGGRAILFPIGDLFNPVYGTLNELTQSSQFPEGLENERINLTPNNFLDVEVKITQPIINNAIKYNIRIQEELVKLYDVDIQLEENVIIFQTRNAYFNYLKTIEGFEILKETESLLNDLLSINKKLVKYNKATGEIIADVEFQLANLESEKAQLNEQQNIAKIYFNILLNRPVESSIEIDSALIKDFKTEVLDLKRLIAIANNNRIEFQKLSIATNVNDLNKERIDKEKMPTLGVTGAVGLQTENFNFDAGGPIYTIGFGMSVNLFDGGRRKKRVEEIDVDQNILRNNRAQIQQQIDVQVSQQFYALQTLERKLRADRLAAIAARKSYSIIKSKYENDKAILLEMTDAQNKLITSELRQVLTKYDYLIKIAELQKVLQSDRLN